MRFVRPAATVPFRTSRSARAVVAVLFVLAGVPACERAPSADGLRDWSPDDHDRAEEQGRVQSGQQAPPEPKGGAGSSPADRGRALVEVAWQQNCASCHGMTGHGDGPSGPMVKASDLTRADWQAKVTDNDIVAVIKAGKGSMPKFDLPEPVVLGLVARIRSLRGR